MASVATAKLANGQAAANATLADSAIVIAGTPLARAQKQRQPFPFQPINSDSAIPCFGLRHSTVACSKRQD